MGAIGAGVIGARAPLSIYQVVVNKLLNLTSLAVGRV